MSANTQYRLGVLEGSILFYSLLAVIILVIVYFVGRKIKKQKSEVEVFQPANPDDLWECPECGEKNPNSSFTCSKCNYRIL